MAILNLSANYVLLGMNCINSYGTAYIFAGLSNSEIEQTSI